MNASCLYSGQAFQVANRYHKGQDRSWENQPYIVHLCRVAATISELSVPDEIVAAAWLHDTLEDTKCTEAYLYMAFPKIIVDIVKEVTNPSETPEHKQKSRSDRKFMNCQHIAKASRYGKILKLADRLDNVRGLIHCPKGYAYKYAKETVQLLDIAFPPIIVDPIQPKLIELIKDVISVYKD